MIYFDLFFLSYYSLIQFVIISIFYSSKRIKRQNELVVKRKKKKDWKAWHKIETVKFTAGLIES